MDETLIITSSLCITFFNVLFLIWSVTFSGQFIGHCKLVSYFLLFLWASFSGIATITPRGSVVHRFIHSISSKKVLLKTFIWSNPRFIDLKIQIYVPFHGPFSYCSYKFRIVSCNPHPKPRSLQCQKMRQENCYFCIIHIVIFIVFDLIYICTKPHWV